MLAGVGFALRVILFCVLALAAFLGIASTYGTILMAFWLAAILAFIGIYEPKASWAALVLFVVVCFVDAGRFHKP